MVAGSHYTGSVLHLPTYTSTSFYPILVSTQETNLVSFSHGESLNLPFSSCFSWMPDCCLNIFDEHD